MLILITIIEKITRFDFAKAQKWASLIFVLAFLLLLLILGLWFNSCQSAKREKKIGQTKEQIIEKKVEANVQANITLETQKATNEAFNNLNKAREANLSQQDGNYNKARERYCQIFEDCK